MPESKDLEDVVLGAIMFSPTARYEVADLLSDDLFYHPECKAIYAAVRSLMQKNDPVDLLTVTQELRKTGSLDQAGGAANVTRMTGKISSLANVERYVYLLKEIRIRRSLIESGTEIVRLGYSEGDPLEALSESERTILSIADDSLSRKPLPVGKSILEAIKKINTMQGRESGLTGVPSGFSALDRLTRGWQDTDFIVLAARPGMGKTAFVLNAATNAAKFGVPVAVFSLEMSSVQLANRLISAEGEIANGELKRTNLSHRDLQRIDYVGKKIGELPIFIDDEPGINMQKLKSRCRRMKKDHGIGLVIVDYLQLMEGDDKSGNREQEISFISRSLKGMAKDMNVPVIALAQLSREVERMPDKRPLLSHLRESGSIEQDADMVGFLYRPEYYGIEAYEDGESTRGVCEFIIAKHRNGSTSSVKLAFKGEYFKFGDMQEGGFQFEDYNPAITTIGGEVF